MLHCAYIKYRDYFDTSTVQLHSHPHVLHSPASISWCIRVEYGVLKLVTCNNCPLCIWVFSGFFAFLCVPNCPSTQGGELAKNLHTKINLVVLFEGIVSHDLVFVSVFMTKIYIGIDTGGFSVFSVDISHYFQFSLSSVKDFIGMLRFTERNFTLQAYK